MMFTRAELMRATNPRSSGSASSNGLSRFGSVAGRRCAERDRLRSFAAARTLPADGESVFSRHDSSRRAKGPQYRPAEG